MLRSIQRIFRTGLAGLLSLAIALSLIPTASTLAQAAPVPYLVVAKADRLPDGLADQVAAAGGTVNAVLTDIGVIAVESANPDFANTIKGMKGVQSVIPDVRVPWVSAEDFAFTGRDFAFTGRDFSFTGRDFSFTGRDFAFTGRDFSFTGRASNPPVDDFFPFQWNMDAIHAPEAWAAGAAGKGVRVAVLDAGFELIHPDFFWIDPETGTSVNNMDAASGASFVTGEFLQFDNNLPVASHATHVAGIIAAANNGIGVVGVAPEATIVPIKVLRDLDLEGDFSWVIQGLYHAAKLQGDQAVDVINMSLGAAIPRNGFCDSQGVCIGANDVADLVNLLKRAIHYADKQGITVVAAAGNGFPPIDMDHAGNLLFLPADIPGVITVSATGPNGWGLNPATNLDLPAFYSFYGKSYVDFAAPGGNVDLAALTDPNHPLWGSCTIGGFSVEPCGTADLVPSTLAANNGGWGWLYGTSMAAPHVAGVAALIIGQNGGSMKPSQVEAKLRQSADDLGQPGNDDFYGQGRVNAFNAVR